jgi:hypothetical protein
MTAFPLEPKTSVHVVTDDVVWCRAVPSRDAQGVAHQIPKLGDALRKFPN